MAGILLLNFLCKGYFFLSTVLEFGDFSLMFWVYCVPYMSLFLLYLFLFTDCCVFFDLWEYNDNILKFFPPFLVSRSINFLVFSGFVSVSKFLQMSVYLIAQILEMSRSGLGVSQCLVSISLNPPPLVCALISPLKSSPVHILHRTNFHSHWNVGRHQESKFA